MLNPVPPIVGNLHRWDLAANWPLTTHLESLELMMTSALTLWVPHGALILRMMSCLQAEWLTNFVQKLLFFLLNGKVSSRAIALALTQNHVAVIHFMPFVLCHLQHIALLFSPFAPVQAFTLTQTCRVGGWAVGEAGEITILLWHCGYVLLATLLLGGWDRSPGLCTSCCAEMASVTGGARGLGSRGVMSDSSSCSRPPAWLCVSYCAASVFGESDAVTRAGAICLSLMQLAAASHLVW